MRHAIFSELFLLAAIAWSAPVTIVLQEGLNGYTGVEDAYISSTTAGSNYGVFTDLIAKNEMCVA